MDLEVSCAGGVCIHQSKPHSLSWTGKMSESLCRIALRILTFADALAPLGRRRTELKVSDKSPLRKTDRT